MSDKYLLFDGFSVKYIKHYLHVLHLVRWYIMLEIGLINRFDGLKRILHSNKVIFRY
jgi:hypothetical protein